VNCEAPLYYDASNGLDNRSWEYAKPIKTHAVPVILRELPGWIPESQQELLVDLAIQERPATIVQLGVGAGKTLLAYAIVLRFNLKGEIFGIDPYLPSLGFEPKQTLDLVADTIEKYGLQEQISLICKLPEEADRIERIDILHIKEMGSISFSDLETWAPYVKKGGWIVFEGSMLSRSANWLNSHCMPIAEFIDPFEWGIWFKQ
jgi:hypothetical protein